MTKDTRYKHSNAVIVEIKSIEFGAKWATLHSNVNGIDWRRPPEKKNKMQKKWKKNPTKEDCDQERKRERENQFIYWIYENEDDDEYVSYML